MPVYDFTCRECRKRFSVTKPVAEYDPKKIACPKCKSRKVHRRWGSVFAKTSSKS